MAGRTDAAVVIGGNTPGWSDTGGWSKTGRGVRVWVRVGSSHGRWELVWSMVWSMVESVVESVVGTVAEDIPATFFQQSLGVGLMRHCLWPSSLQPRGGPTTPC